MIKWTSWVGVVHISLNLARSGCPSVFAWRRTLSLNALKKIQGSLSSIQGLTVRRVGCWNTCVQTSEAGRVFFRHFSKYEFDFWTERFKNQIFQWVESGSVSEIEGIGRGRCAIDIELWINCKICMYTSHVKSMITVEKESWDSYYHNTPWFVCTLLATKRKNHVIPPKILLTLTLCKELWQVPMASKEKKT